VRDSAALGISVVDYARDSRVKYTEWEVEGYRDLEHWPFGPRILATDNYVLLHAETC